MTGPTTSRRCCSSACTTPGARRWRSGGSTTSPASRAVAWSGGSEPADEVNPPAVAAMAEVGIDIAQRVPEAVDRRDRAGRRRRRHDGLRRRVPALPGQALRGLGARRPGRAGRRRGAADPRRDRAARAGAPGVPRQLTFASAASYSSRDRAACRGSGTANVADDLARRVSITNVARLAQPSCSLNTPYALRDLAVGPEVARAPGT